jgi:two-component system, OmpR family, phosphate regulon sensor histidine kinase PhoR
VDALSWIALGVAGAVILALLIWRFDQGRRQRALDDVVRRMAAGDLSVRAPSGLRGETAGLAASVNRLAREVDRRIEAARAERRRLETILSAMEEGVLLIDASDRVGYANPAAARLLRGAPRSLRSTPATLQGLVGAIRSEGEPTQTELETGVPVRVLRATALPVGQEGAVLLVLRDVTAARRVEAMRRDFVADASHELKTPAASIQAAAETLQRAVADDPTAAARFAERLRRDAVRLSRIVSDLLDLSRLESERPAFDEVRLDRVALDEADRLRDQAREAGVELEVDGEPVTVAGSRKDLALLASNLLDNAIRYTGRGGRVTLSVAARDGAAVLTVADTGIGIPTRDLPRIFERFYRVDRARSRDTGGTGLGLSIARHVAERHGGRIAARSELGRGSTFTVTLPLPPG